MPKVILNKESLHETSIFISRTSAILIIYLILTSVLSISNKLPLIICTLLFTAVLNQTTMLQTIKKRISKYAFEINEVKEIKLSSQRQELLTAVNDIKDYLDNAYQWNNRRRILFRQMSPLQQQLAKPVDYPKKLNLIDKYFQKNNKILSTILSNSIKKHDIKDFELKFAEEQAKASKRNNYFRVVESLCHYARDWSVQPCDEITPLLDYIKHECKNFNNEKTIAIVPGSGLGRVAHTLANDMKFSSVHAVEFSSLMVLMNEFLYTTVNEKKVNVYPYLHTYSNHVTLEDQIRPVEILHSLKKPENLTIHTANFTKFDIGNYLKQDESADNLVFITCFFLDTAENLIEYLQAINRLSSQFKGKKKWINLGPLKYGTAAKIEVSDEELKILVKTMGWTITDEQDPKLLGYLTDKKGLWQGYYNVSMWSAEKH
jgi:hypothetical protein